MLSYITGGIEHSLLLKLDYILEENRILRNQVSQLHLTDAERISLAEKGKALGKMLWDIITIVKPETLLKWHRELIARKWDTSHLPKKSGRPLITREIEELILQLARENPSWGYDRISGALSNLGHEVCDQTVGNVLQRNGVGTAPERKRNSTWKSFLKSHHDILWATDFFTSEVWTSTGLTTFYALFFIHIQTRKIILGGITHSPNAPWMQQVARNVTAEMDCSKTGYLLRDRDDKYTEAFDDLFKTCGIKPIPLPPRSPNLNAFAERWVKSVKTECLDQVILFGENQLRYVLREYLTHYHQERNHQGIGNLIPFPDQRIKVSQGEIARAERLGGLLNFYHRKAA